MVLNETKNKFDMILTSEWIFYLKLLHYSYRFEFIRSFKYFYIQYFFHIFTGWVCLDFNKGNVTNFNFLFGFHHKAPPPPTISFLTFSLSFVCFAEMGYSGPEGRTAKYSVCLCDSH